MKTRPWITTCTAAALVGVAGPALAAEPTPAPAARFAAEAVAAPPAVATADEAEQSILDRTNALRAAHGVAPVVRDAAIDAVAAAWAEHLAVTGEFRHNPGYAQQIPPGWRTAGENIAMNSWDPVELSTQWENSPGHRANLLNATYTHLGVAVVEHGGLYYGVQVFAGY